MGEQFNQGVLPFFFFLFILPENPVYYYIPKKKGETFLFPLKIQVYYDIPKKKKKGKALF